MATEWFFDAARLGRMRPAAQRADRDFAGLASQLGSPLYWEAFLADGYAGLPPTLRTGVPGLAPWQGVTGLKRSLAKLVGLSPGGSVLLAGGSRTLMQLAAEALFDRCRAVLATDLEWPPYLVLLRRVAIARGKRLVIARLRGRVLSATMASAHLIDQVAAHYRDAACDGYFLSHVTHHGARLPLAMLVERLREVRVPRLGVVDGCQALGHVPIDLESLGVDIYLAGAHKWLGAYLPLRVAFANNGTLDPTQGGRVPLHATDDPMMAFCDSLITKRPMRWGETVNLAPLMTAAGALGEVNAQWVRRTYALRRASAAALIERLAAVATAALHPSLHSGAALLRIHDAARCGELRTWLACHCVVASEPAAGLLRLAMPEKPITRDDVAIIQSALRRERHVSICGVP